jgi:hypothetical protein
MGVVDLRLTNLPFADGGQRLPYPAKHPWLRLIERFGCCGAPMGRTWFVGSAYIGIGIFGGVIEEAFNSLQESSQGAGF